MVLIGERNFPIRRSSHCLPDRNGANNQLSERPGWELQLKSPSSLDPVCRVLLEQPALPQYRWPVFRNLARRPNLQLTCIYGDEPGLDNTDPQSKPGPAGSRGHWISTKSQRIGFGNFRPFFRHPGVAQWIRRNKPDCVVLTWNTRNLTLYESMISARLVGSKIVLWGHGYSKRETLLRQTIRSVVGRFADCLLFYSETGREKFRLHSPKSPPSFVARNAIDFEALRPALQSVDRSSSSRIHFLQANGVNPEQPVILYVSRIQAANRLDWLIDAITQIQPKIPVTLVVIGSDPDEQTDKLKQRNEASAHPATIRWLGPNYDETALAHWFVYSDVFCYPQNVGLSILHAMFYGLPVVTSDNADKQNPEFEAVVPGVNAVTFRDGSIKDLAKQLTNLLDSEALRHKIGDAGRNYILSNYSIASMVDGFIDAISQATDRQL